MIAKIREPKPAVHQNIHLSAAEQAEPEPRVNIVTRSGVSTSGTSQETGKNTEQEWVCRAPNKATPLDLQKKKKHFRKLRLSLMTLRNQDHRYHSLGAYCSKDLVVIALYRHRRLPHLEDAMRRRWQEASTPSCGVV